MRRIHSIIFGLKPIIWPTTMCRRWGLAWVITPLILTMKYVMTGLSDRDLGGLTMLIKTNILSKPMAVMTDLQDLMQTIDGYFIQACQPAGASLRKILLRMSDSWMN